MKREDKYENVLRNDKINDYLREQALININNRMNKIEDIKYVNMVKCKKSTDYYKRTKAENTR